MLSNKIKYTSELLDSIMIRDNAVLIGNYNKLNRDTPINFICYCGEQYSKIFRYMYEKCAKCKKCTTELGKNKRIKTNLAIYGVENALLCKTVKDKIKNTMIERYGVEYAFQCDTLKNKVKQTMIERYGVEHALQCDSLKEKAIQTIYNKYGVTDIMQHDGIKQQQKDTNMKRYGVEYPAQRKEIKEKMKKMCMKKYGVEHSSQIPEIIEKKQKTCLIRYGVKHVLQVDKFKEKCKKTCLERHGVEHILQSTNFRDKIKATCLIRYGVEHPQQCQEIMEKTQKNSKKYKEYKMPSGTIRKVQGYEPFALNELVKMYQEDDIITDRKEIPRITYMINDKKKYYFPDIFIKSINTIIEVKSTWTYKIKVDIIHEKANATQMAGYNYEIWIYDGKGNKIKSEMLT